MPTLAEKARAFHHLHLADEILILPNAWDVASAKLIERAGYKAMATTSAGISYTFGVPDQHMMGRDEMLAAVAPIIHLVDVPVTVDVENGYGTTPEEVAQTVRELLKIGAVGGNIEDTTSEFDGTLEDINVVVERLHAARIAADIEGVEFVINARTDGFLFGQPDLATFSDSVKRANAYLAAGARCVFIPGLRDENLIAEMVQEINGPLNLLTVPGLPEMDRLQDLGVARVSTGSSLARAAYGTLKSGLRELGGAGTYSYTDYAISFDEMDGLFTTKE